MKQESLKVGSLVGSIMIFVRDLLSLTFLAFLVSVTRVDAETVHLDIFNPDQQIRGITVEEPIQEFPMMRALENSFSVSKVETVINSGPTSNRLDFVIVGDGFTANESEAFQQAAYKILQELFRSDELFARYQNFINVHLVYLKSDQSGIDNGAPLGSSMGCYTARLLCVDTDKAKAVAQFAPDADFVLVLANTSEYGGAAYPQSGVATVAALNKFAPQIITHEIGHLFGLADEYSADSGVANANALEPASPNVSTFDSSAMLSEGIKWARWLGTYDPTGSVIDTYQGADYTAWGKYRPTQSSKMSNLGVPYNLPSVEAIIEKFYQDVSLVDSITLKANKKIEVSGPDVKSLKVSWSGGKAAKVCKAKKTCDPKALLGNAKSGNFSVTFSDTTASVRDEEFRNTKMTKTIKFRLSSRKNGKIILND